MAEFDQVDGPNILLGGVKLHSFDPSTPQISSVPLSLTPRLRPFGMQGRGTTIVDVIPSLDSSSVGLPAETEMVLKLSWTAKNRVPEITRLEQARDLAAGKPEILKLMPKPILSVNLSQYDTGIFRHRLGCREELDRERTLWAVVFERLRPLQELKGQRLLRAFADCVRCERLDYSCSVFDSVEPGADVVLPQAIVIFGKTGSIIETSVPQTLCTAAPRRTRSLGF
jgi:hypothetical protein